MGRQRRLTPDVVREEGKAWGLASLDVESDKGETRRPWRIRGNRGWGFGEYPTSICVRY